MIIQIIFYIFATISIVSALMVITSVHPVRAVLSKVLAFIAAAGVWMTLQAEFLSLLLIIVYVGAVLVMFLFVVMMIDLDIAAKRISFVKHWPLCLITILTFVGILIYIFMHTAQLHTTGFTNLSIAPTSQNDVKTLGVMLFTHDLLAFEMVGMILLAAMVSAITLTFRHKRKSNKNISPSIQAHTQASDRISLVSLPTESPLKSGDDS